MTEEWRPIEGYLNKYFVSNIGRVKNCHGRILARDVAQRGYLRVKLCFGGVSIAHKVHRLVASAFIPNPKNLPQINHIDENKRNNNVDNLEWCDNKTNCGLRKNKKFKKRPVVMCDLKGNPLREFSSINEASVKTGVNRYGILSVCNGVQYEAGGYYWKDKTC